MHDFQCPGCDRILTRFVVVEAPVYARQNGCGGVWLDGGELQTIREIAAEKADQTTFIERRPAVDPDWDASHPRPQPKYEVSTRDELHKIFYGDPEKRAGVRGSIKNFLNAEL